MDGTKGKFDSASFFSALDSTKVSRGLTWKQVADESGVSASTLTRMSQGKRPDVDGLAALSSWAGLDIGDFVRFDGEKTVADPLAMISTSLKSDRNLSPESATALDELIKATYQRLRRKSE